ncbi:MULTISPECIES: hypothetical protein [Leisingera]|uniref:hypothetical protein n=1 Tax=Leisingera TaxID=191028 RepID=UPI00041BFDAC|nr:MULTISPECIES: hypothetical protein [Leisingera]
MKPLFLAGAAALLLGACASTPAALPEIAALERTAAQSGPYRKLNYQPPFSGFEAQEPSDPGSWRGVNDEQQENH